jgi:hypothetical protein
MGQRTRRWRQTLPSRPKDEIHLGPRGREFSHGGRHSRIPPGEVGRGLSYFSGQPRKRETLAVLAFPRAARMGIGGRQAVGSEAADGAWKTHRRRLERQIGKLPWRSTSVRGFPWELIATRDLKGEPNGRKAIGDG